MQKSIFIVPSIISESLFPQSVYGEPFRVGVPQIINTVRKSCNLPVALFGSGRLELKTSYVWS